ncbi:hypothetical protein EG68_04752 [Paragonimus skrjabini miyazakii]|uniref:DUF7041 domain-containing protein n=1 Tax=Paragonimus skrjabini miyazakii TaxID=59628 RepID=A0A8S9YSN4_9TREM|nr:hypothetical protein EG68_04752 [Paragonimus skrjabini miyazakii]
MQFHTRGITHSSTRFSYIISTLPSDIVEEARDILMSPHPTEPYEHLKSTLLKGTTASEQKLLEALISGEELGEALFRQLFLQRLSNFVGTILASRGHIALDELAELADDIMSISNDSYISALAPHSRDTLTQILLQQIEKELFYHNPGIQNTDVLDCPRLTKYLSSEDGIERLEGSGKRSYRLWMSGNPLVGDVVALTLEYPHIEKILFNRVLWTIM